jgi:catechol 2,3-dioxygenase-like lactoylglutathione lyase family enzyme
MAYLMSHVGLTVPDLRGAEAFYGRVFGMEVLVREIRDGSAWRSLDPAIGWTEAARLALHIHMVVLTRDQFAVALDEGIELGRPTHLGLFVEPTEYDSILTEVKRDGLELRETSTRRFLFADPYRVLWEVQSEPRLLTAKDMNMGWVSADGAVHADDTREGTHAGA